jgi:hypothetical protein
MECAPLPRNLPRSGREIGEPIASAVLVQEYLIGLLFLRLAGWFFMAVASLLFCAVVVLLITSWRGGPGHENEWSGLMCIGGLALLVGTVGLWFGILRGRVVMERCWLCHHGIIWMTNGVFDCIAWQDVPEVYCDLEAPRPAIGIRFDRNLSWISFAATESARRMIQHVETCASADRIQRTLRLLAEGRAVYFGDTHLHRHWLDSPHARIDWNNVSEIRVGDRYLELRGRDNQVVAAIPFKEIPFVSLFIALVRAILSVSVERRPSGI